MRKKLFGITVLSAALAISASMPAFAGWVQDSNGWAYQNDDGSWRGAGWLTDPADGSIYYLNPDGYMMTDTRVEGFRLGPDGRRIEKTEAEIQAEAERKQKEASKASPSKQHTQAQLAADAAKSGTQALSTTRLAYQAEMQKLMDTIFIDARKSLDNTIVGSTTEDNMEATYRYTVNSNKALEASLWKVSNKKHQDYKPQAFDLFYNRTALPDEASIAITDTAFRRLCVASLGETTGNTLFDNILAENAKGNTVFTWEGNTDTGNAYVMNCSNGTVSIQVTCSEKTAEQIAAEQAAAETEAAAQQ